MDKHLENIMKGYSTFQVKKWSQSINLTYDNYKQYIHNFNQWVGATLKMLLKDEGDTFRAKLIFSDVQLYNSFNFN